MSTNSDDQAPEETNYLARGMTLGMAIGAGLGVALGVALDNLAFISIGIGAGMSTIGLAVGASMNERNKAKDA